MAFFLWGVLPVFWKSLAFLPPISIVAQRTLWSLLILVAAVAIRREFKNYTRAFVSLRTISWYLLSGIMLSSNWLLYVWATLNDHILEGALGYYLNPFFNMLFGALWFGERHNRTQLFAIGIALCGVLLQIPAVGRLPLIALTLAITFSLYAVIRKKASLGALTGLAAETTLLAPIALIWLLVHSASPAEAFGGTPGRALLVIATGLATAAPLLCFSHAARSISLTTLGILQFIGPTLQFLIGWKLYGEPMGILRLTSFSLIWLAISLYAWDGIRKRSTAAQE
jgi:chloramphenicol-sensitive protein RarD